jgi:hypothetical protein
VTPSIHKPRRFPVKVKVIYLLVPLYIPGGGDAMLQEIISLLHSIFTDARNTLAALAILISVTTFALSFWFTWRSAVAAKRPVLVFAYEGKTGWVIRNIGGGPALNVIVAQKKVGGEWFNPVRIPPLARDKDFVPVWLDHVNTTGLGAIYSDFENRPYTSTCGNDLSVTLSGAKFGPWPEHLIGRHWKQPLYHESNNAEEQHP